MIQNFVLDFFKFSVAVSFSNNLLASIALTFLTNSAYTIFLINFFFTTLLSLLKSTGPAFSFSSSNLSSSDFRLVKSFFLANFNVSTPATFF